MPRICILENSHVLLYMQYAPLKSCFSPICWLVSEGACGRITQTTLKQQQASWPCNRTFLSFAFFLYVCREHKHIQSTHNSVSHFCQLPVIQSITYLGSGHRAVYSSTYIRVVVPSSEVIALSLVCKFAKRSDEISSV